VHKTQHPPLHFGYFAQTPPRLIVCFPGKKKKQTIRGEGVILYGSFFIIENVSKGSKSGMEAILQNKQFHRNNGVMKIRHNQETSPAVLEVIIERMFC
jgi:hypothetical protein